MSKLSYACLPVILIFLLGCDDMFVKVIDIDESDRPPMLSISAVFDTDSGRLKLHIRDVQSLNYYKTYQPESREIIRNGTIRLYENDREIFSKSATFDLSTGYKNGRGVDGYFGAFTGIPALPGCTYRLEVNIEGYPESSASDIMPDAPLFDDKIIKSLIVRIDKILGFCSGRSPRIHHSMLTRCELLGKTFQKKICISGRTICIINFRHCQNFFSRFL